MMVVHDSDVGHIRNITFGIFKRQECEL